MSRELPPPVHFLSEIAGDEIPVAENGDFDSAVASATSTVSADGAGYRGSMRPLQCA